MRGQAKAGGAQGCGVGQTVPTLGVRGVWLGEGGGIPGVKQGEAGRTGHGIVALLKELLLLAVPTARMEIHAMVQSCCASMVWRH